MAGDVMTTDIVVGRRGGGGGGRGIVLERPSPGGASPPAESSVLVSGAGTAEVNVLHTPRGTHNGRTYFKPVGQPNDLGAPMLYWTGSSWDIALADASTGYSNDGEDVASPWLSAAWVTIDGAEPVPTVTEA